MIIKFLFIGKGYRPAIHPVDGIFLVYRLVNMQDFSGKIVFRKIRAEIIVAENTHKIPFKLKAKDIAFELKFGIHRHVGIFRFLEFLTDVKGVEQINTGTLG
ncbi:hypothetical protein D9M68_612640 [compost metagenome]